MVNKDEYYMQSHSKNEDVINASYKSQLKFEYEIYLIYYLCPPRPAQIMSPIVKHMSNACLWALRHPRSE